MNHRVKLCQAGILVLAACILSGPPISAALTADDQKPLVALAGMAPAAEPAPQSPQTALPPAALGFGAAYYPELDEPRAVEVDAQLMQAAGFNLVRMGEFAWIRMEPNDGKFDFAWLDQAVETLARHGIRSLLGTPTASPPKWLLDRHDDIYQIMVDGRRRDFGRRRNYCPNNENYRQHTARIVIALAEHFKNNPNVVGYQIDNEFMAEQPQCYCETCQKKFQTWLRAKYGTIGELNRRWGTLFWSHSFRNFGEVALPRGAGYNPSALLDYYRFSSDSFLEYARLQGQCIKKVSPQKSITHNVCSGGFLYLLDLYKLGAQLDFLSVDNYPLSFSFENEYGNSGDRPYDPAMASFALSIIRGARHAPFWVTEAQVGRTLRPRPLCEPGMINVLTHQEIAHGAKAVLYFHWRQFPFGCEQLLQAVLDCDGKPRRRYYEVQQTVRDLSRATAEIAGACPRPEIAIIRDFDCDWALDGDRPHPEFRYLRHLYLYYEALFRNHVNADAVAPTEDLARYKLVLAPSLLLVDEARAANLRRYVEQGGTLVVTCQSGLRNLDNVFHRETQPAHLRDLCGLEIEEQNALKFQDVTGIAPIGGGYAKPRYDCSLLFEIIKPTTAKPLAAYTDRWFAGTPAMTVNRVGKGTVYYLATVPPPEFLRDFIRQLLPACGLAPNIAAASSPMVESVKSSSGNNEYLHLINFTGAPQSATLLGDYENLADHSTAKGEQPLPPFGAVILKRKAPATAPMGP
jgi:beta-galactosidase